MDEGGGTRPLAIRNTADPEEGDSEQCRIDSGTRSDINTIAKSRAFRVRSYGLKICTRAVLWKYLCRSFDSSHLTRADAAEPELACTRQKVPLNTLLYLMYQVCLQHDGPFPNRAKIYLHGWRKQLIAGRSRHRSGRMKPPGSEARKRPIFLPPSISDYAQSQADAFANGESFDDHDHSARSGGTSSRDNQRVEASNQPYFPQVEGRIWR